jgi:hypothetical protein
LRRPISKSWGEKGARLAARAERLKLLKRHCFSVVHGERRLSLAFIFPRVFHASFFRA